jgi:hypothetical protein
MKDLYYFAAWTDSGFAIEGGSWDETTSFCSMTYPATNCADIGGYVDDGWL